MNKKIFQYDAIIYRQRKKTESPVLALFSAPVGEVLEWATIERSTESNTGHQRALKISKVNAVKNYFKNDANNTIPTSVTIILRTDEQDMDVSEKPSRYNLSIKPSRKGKNPPGLVIDGQHRLLGMNEFDPQIHVSVVALINASDVEAAFQFLVINNKSSKVSSDHIRTLALKYDKGVLSDRLKRSRITLNKNLQFVGIVEEDENSPFKGLVSLETQKDESKKIIDPAAIEAAFAYIREQNVPELSDTDDLYEFFFALWRPIKEKWSDKTWGKESYLTKKVGIICMTMYLTDMIIHKYDLDDMDITDPERIQAQVSEILESQEEAFWHSSWKSSSYDTKAGRASILKALTQIVRNQKKGLAWHEDIDMLDIDQSNATL